MADLTVSALLSWPHKYLLPIPQSIVLSMPTYLLPDSSDPRPEFNSHLGGGGWFLNHGPLAHRHLSRYSRLLHQSDHLFRHQMLLRSCCDFPLSFFDRDPCYCPSAPPWDP